jgi:hypothetical protein
MPNVGLDPWYTYGDERYFNVVNGSTSANAQIDMSLLYDRYYDRAESLPAITDFEVVVAPEPEPCDDGSQPPCAVVDDSNDGGDDSNDTPTDESNTTVPGTNTEVGNDQTGPAPIDVSQSEEEDVAGQALLLFIVIVAILLVSLYFVSKGGEDALAAEVQIEKMWDEQEAAAASDGAFVPSLPPLEPPKEETE